MRRCRRLSPTRYQVLTAASTVSRKVVIPGYSATPRSPPALNAPSVGETGLEPATPGPQTSTYYWLRLTQFRKSGFVANWLE